MQLYDTHAHLDLYLQRLGILPEEGRELDFSSLSSSVLDAVHAKMESDLSNHAWIVQPTISAGNYVFTSQLWNTYSNIYVLFGGHPELVNQTFIVNEYWKQVQDAIPEDLSVITGVGEVGLDYYYSDDGDIHAKQKDMFERYIQFAIQWGKPLIIHCREAFNDLFEILDAYPAIHGNFLIHCFTSHKDDAKKVVDRGGFMAIGGVSTFKNASELHDAIKYAPLESLFLETDLPFLAPVPHRGKVCEPKMVESIAYRIGELKGVEVEKVIEVTQKQAEIFFNI